SVAWLPRRCCLLSEKVSGTLEPVRRAKLFTSSEGSRHLFGQTLRKATKAQRPVIRLRLCAFARAMPNPPLRDQLLANAGLADNVDGPIAGSHELLGSVDADLAVDGHRQVLDGERVVLRFGGGGVGAAVDETFLDAAAREDDAEDLRPVVAAGRRIHLGCAAELRRDHDQRGLEQ